MNESARPWPALWALVVGFFMIMIDATIVSVANPRIMEGLNTDINSVIWVTSAYLLAYAVPLLVTGRLGDRFGPRNLYLVGLVVFTLSSVWCGFSGTITMLILARVFQGIGAALLSPQTMTVITRMFPPDRRGAAMGIWGSVAGVAALIGPIFGGLLVDWLGWEWIFFVNLPVGIIAFILAWVYVPALRTHSHRFDVFGVILSAIGMFLLVFGIQEGEDYHWGTIVGPISVWSLIIAGLVVLAGFVVWQHLNRVEPLVPLRLFKTRNFSLANGAITMVSFTVTALPLPLIFYFQLVRGMTPTQSALMMVPMAVLGGILSPLAGRLADRIPPRYVGSTGLVLVAASLAWYVPLIRPDTSIWLLLAPSALMGLGNSAIWSPVSATVTHDLPMRDAGAGSGVYNATRQIGAVLGSACIAVLMEALLAAKLPGATGAGTTSLGSSGALPAFLHAGFSEAMGQSLLVPAAVALAGAVIVACFANPKRGQEWNPHTAPVAIRPEEIATLPGEAVTRDDEASHVSDQAGSEPLSEVHSHHGDASATG